MCGIVGFVRAEVGVMMKASEIMEDLLFIDTIRGDGGTGVAYLKSFEEGPLVVKRGLAAPDFIRLPMWDRAKWGMGQNRFVIGHNRAATYGSVQDRNAHPFHYDGKDHKSNLVLVHNGTVSNYLDITRDTGFKHDVDSAHIAYAMSKFGEEEVLGKLDGFAVLVWYNHTNKTFNIYRNNNRDINFIFDSYGNMFYASEATMLNFVLTRHGVSIKNSGNKDTRTFYQVPEACWFRWKLEGDGFLDLTQFEKIKVKSTVKLNRRFGGMFPNTCNVDLEDDGDDTVQHDDDVMGDNWINRSIRQSEKNKQWAYEYDRSCALLKNHGLNRADGIFVRSYRYVGPQNVIPGQQGTVYANLVSGVNVLKDDLLVEVELSHVFPLEFDRYKKICDKLGGKMPVYITGVRDRQSSGTIFASYILTGTLNTSLINEWAKEDKPANVSYLPVPPRDVTPLSSNGQVQVKGPNGAFVTIKEFWQLTSKGCKGCHYSTPRIDEARDILWLPTFLNDHRQWLCPDCAEKETRGRLAEEGKLKALADAAAADAASMEIDNNKPIPKMN